ncbi:bifunctional folylpolyglutamate synthase/dihydrofolate synthase [Candidatus Puniceispirillum sp.]|nr:bifunctional folylpolyglutamate synthase/dihydrofolate synthase [Candidatus Puniceispirillum sp.]
MPSSSALASGAASRALATLDRLTQLHPKLIDLSLNRSFILLDKLDNPHHHLPPTIHVAGTNGKGSVIAFLRAMAEAAGLNVHVYNSPHLCRFNERIRLAGSLISDEKMADLLEEVETVNGDMAVTFFEVTTAAAMLAYSRVPADLLLLETGLGGALDSTNVLTAPLATIITPIAKDHEHFLGSNLNDIASQKAGIMRKDTPCFSASQDIDVAYVLDSYAAKIGASIYQAGRDFYLSPAPNGGIHLGFGDTDIALPTPTLLGAHQLDNAGLAAACLTEITRQNLLPSAPGKIDLAALNSGTVNAVWPGRVQSLSNGAFADQWPHQPIWLDGAHNAHGASALADALRQIHTGKWNIICGALNTRDPTEFLTPLTSLAGRVRCLTIPSQDASLEAENLAKTAAALGLDSAPSANIEAAFSTLDTGLPVIICGSLYLAGYALVQNKTLPN